VKGATWRKIALGTVVGAFATTVALALIIGPPPAKATADNAVKACRSSDYAPGTEFLGSVSRVRPDGTWTPRESSPGIYTMDQQVSTSESAYGNRYTPSPPWTCTAYMDKDGLWTAVWDAQTGLGPVGTWHVKDSELRSVAAPRDLSGPGRRA
jgi:hypothetical protein